MSFQEDLSLAAIHRLIKKAGAERVSKSACKELSRVLEKSGIEISKEAIEFMMHAGRKTVRGKDIKIAARKVLDL